ncbi:GNAT family N-acetyltransferase, partial [Streptomyces sp. NPDC048506]|uniref:GNAT family N-acetyltransferase n=1 Tax=Streptomyces sp. NPDC048506 TaxID=3155028 RepID=UPI00342F77FF
MSVRITALTDPDTSLASRRLAWLASDSDGIPVGSAFLRFYTKTGQDHLAALELHVHAAERRKCTGSRLLDAAVAAARQDGRRCVITQAEAGSPGDWFLWARGFCKVLTLIYTRLSLAEVDVSALAEIAE